MDLVSRFAALPDCNSGSTASWKINFRNICVGADAFPRGQLGIRQTLDSTNAPQMLRCKRLIVGLESRLTVFQIRCKLGAWVGGLRHQRHSLQNEGTGDKEGELFQSEEHCSDLSNGL